MPRHLSAVIFQSVCLWYIEHREKRMTSHSWLGQTDKRAVFHYRNHPHTHTNTCVMCTNVHAYLYSLRLTLKETKKWGDDEFTGKVLSPLFCSHHCWLNAGQDDRCRTPPNPPYPIPQSCQSLMVHSNKPTFNLHITGMAPTYWPARLLLSNRVSANLKVEFEMESIRVEWMAWWVNYMLNPIHSGFWH